MGIENYEPCFFTTEEDFLNSRGELFKEIKGKRLLKIMWVWDIKSNQWFKDMPVLLFIENEIFAVLNYEIGSIAFDKNVLIGTEKIDWYGIAGYEWKEYGCGTIQDSIVEDISLEKGKWTTTKEFDSKGKEKKDFMPYENTVLTGIRLTFSKSSLTIENALDENDIVIRSL